VENSAQRIKFGAQTVYFETKGAFTAAVSAPMVKSLGCDYVLVGHSERRTVFGESNGDINKSLKQVQAHGMVPILCVGETLAQYEQGSALVVSTVKCSFLPNVFVHVVGLNNQVISEQLTLGLAGVSAEDAINIVLAYEPVRINFCYNH
jgi:triosephosphate isomerase (TIM)